MNNRPSWLDQLTPSQIERMTTAGIKTVDCMRVLSKTGHSLVSEILMNNGDFTQWEHYPPDDVHDPDSHSHYYFHAHAPEESLNHDFGHFHTFIMPLGIPEHLSPVKSNGAEYPSDGSCHLIAISMSPDGMPERLFTTNRWVTGEAWYAASDVIRLLDCFEMDVAHPSWPLNQWLSAMVVLFRPQIETLVRQRDETIAQWQAQYPDRDAFEDRELEVTSSVDISLIQQITWLDEKQLSSSGS